MIYSPGGADVHRIKTTGQSCYMDGLDCCSGCPAFVYKLPYVVQQLYPVIAFGKQGGLYMQPISGGVGDNGKLWSTRVLNIDLVIYGIAA